ncbi:DNA-deoxyinosine glycosylase [Hyphomicrobium sp.]|uniref:DNA-deoxyinosine glycosylase n=1 Tax=Hyphomicrobium sp. TaxID=82 RepID=UPI000FACB175|nr:DNA-deoxyinosine glycosylase [Hyphomicrobium sp.]RUO98448.1 MAG: DNA-deoxyinosine glycosylase [Hyphomicrobium sp.]
MANPISMIKYSFPPIVPERAKLLILGTLPGEESLRLQQYYGFGRNHFWALIAALIQEPVPMLYPDRIALMHAHRWALWDVLAGAERIGSSDAAIRNPSVNDFATFFAANPTIEAVAFNGQKAHDLFRRHVVKAGMVDGARFTTIQLPSSSPLHTIPFEEKLDAWRTSLSLYLPDQKRRAK